MAPNPQQNIGEIAAQSLAAVRLFEKLGIDYCCGGRRPLAEVCQEKGLSADEIVTQLSQEASPVNDRDWSKSSLSALIQHIVATHHDFLKSELPRLSAQIDKVVAAHASRDPETFVKIQRVFAALQNDLDQHLMKEEQILFPYIQGMESPSGPGHSCFGTVQNPIRMMEIEHDEAGSALAALRQLTAGYQPPEWACPTLRALYTGLAALEEDLHLHIHLENNILHPGALALERSAH